MPLKNRTTEDLREILFDAIEQVRDGRMETKEGTVLANMADRIIKTAEIELKYALTCSKLDRENQGINPGPLLLTAKEKP